MPELAYIGIGSNLGDRRAYLESGLEELTAVPGVEFESVSSAYETAPQGYTDQPSFLNAVFSVHTSLSAHELLLTMQEIENRRHRHRHRHWGPRTLDLDLLLYGDHRIETENLVLPHPRIAERCFVLAPLCEITPDLRHPCSGQLFAENLQAIAGTQQFYRVGSLKIPLST